MATVAEIFKSMEYGPAPETDQPARNWLGKFERVFGHFIDGEWTEPGETFDVINPANREVLARVTQGPKADVDAAVAAARAALPPWRATITHPARLSDPFLAVKAPAQAGPRPVLSSFDRHRPSSDAGLMGRLAGHTRARFVSFTGSSHWWPLPRAGEVAAELEALWS